MVAAIITVGWSLDSGMDANPELKARLGQWLRQNVVNEPKVWVRAINQRFLELFDLLFGARGTTSSPHLPR